MQTVIDEFDERVAEVEEFLKVLERLENPAVVLYHKTTRRQIRVFEEGSLKVMKATVFLLVYNVVESSIRSAFTFMYDRIKSEGMACSDLSMEMRSIWIRQQFDQMDDDSAAPRNYRQLAETLANDIMQKSAVGLSASALPVSGNLDSSAIRRVCRSHGVGVKVHYRASGGVELETVKNQRNGLAHGSTSFSDCGQQYTVSDLKRIKQQAFIFVKGILRNLRRFIDDKRYASGS